MNHVCTKEIFIPKGSYGYGETRNVFHYFGAKTILACAGRQSTPSRGRQCKAQNGRLRQLGWTYRHGTVFGPRQYLYQKEATGMERPEMFSTISVQKPYLPVRAVKIPRHEGVSIGPRMESCVNWGEPISMVPCLHQGNTYTIRKLRIWRDQKCVPLIGAKTILTCAGHQNTPSRGRQYRARNGKLRKF